VYLLSFTKLKRKRLKTELAHSFQSLKQMKQNSISEKEMVLISNDGKG